MDELFGGLRTPRFLDGATGTGLQKRGLPPGACSERWILEHPSALLDLQRRYVQAGSDALYAPTFGANRASLGKYGAAGQVRAYNLALTALSREASEGRVPVGGDLSSTGLLPPPLGETSFAELVDIFTEQAAALSEAGVDFFAVETQTSLAEARAIVLAVRAVSDKPILCSFPLAAGGRTFGGGDLAGILVSLEAMGVAAFGVNCLGDLELLCRKLEELRPLTALPLVAKPNAGLPTRVDGRSVYDLPPETMGAYARRFVQAGAALLGGCCGTDERHIAAMRAAAGNLRLPERREPETALYACEFAAVPEGTPAEELRADGDFEDNARAAVAAGARLLRVELGDEAALETVLEAQSLLKAPLWVRCPDESLKARFLREYNGKAKME